MADIETRTIRKGLAADRPTLAIGELGMDTDTGDVWIGKASGNELIGPIVVPTKASLGIADGIIWCSHTGITVLAAYRYIFPFEIRDWTGTMDDNYECWIVPRPGIIKNLCVQQNNLLNGRTLEITMMKYQTATALTKILTGTTTPFGYGTNLVNSVSVVAGDRIQFRYIMNTGGAMTVPVKITAEIYYT